MQFLHIYILYKYASSDNINWSFLTELVSKSAIVQDASFRPMSSPRLFQSQFFISGIAITIIGVILSLSQQIEAMSVVCTGPTIQFVTTTLPNGVITTSTIYPSPCSAVSTATTLSYLGIPILALGICLVFIGVIRNQRTKSNDNDGSAENGRKLFIGQNEL